MALFRKPSSFLIEVLYFEQMKNSVLRGEKVKLISGIKPSKV